MENETVWLEIIDYRAMHTLYRYSPQGIGVIDQNQLYTVAHLYDPENKRWITPVYLHKNEYTIIEPSRELQAQWSLYRMKH